MVLFASFTAMGYGLYIQEQGVSNNAEKYIGAGVIGLFLIAMPLFLYKESRGKNMKDYMLTKENIEKMRKNEAEKADNQ